MADFGQLASVQALGGALLHFLWQGALIGLAAAALLRITNSASVRYAIGIGALIAMLLAPAATFFALLSSPPETAPAVPGAVTLSQVLAQPIAVASQLASATPSSTGVPLWPVAGVFVWMSGILVLSIRLAGGWLVARRMATRAVRPAAAHIQAVAAALADRLALGRVVDVFESSTVAVPVVVGWLRPAVIFPVAALAGLSPAQIEALLAHELAHVRRHDYLINLLQSFAEVVLFYHPAVWWLSSRVRAERELCCDDLAVGVCDRLVYATALTDLAAMRSPSVALAATGGDLLARVRRILGREEPSMSSKGRWIPAVVVAAVMVAAVPALLASVRSNQPSGAIDAPSVIEVATPVSAGDVARTPALNTPESEQQINLEDLVRKLQELQAQVENRGVELSTYALAENDQQSRERERVEQAQKEAEERARQAEIAVARQQLERARRMFETGLATRAQVSEAEAAVAIAEAGRDERRVQQIQIEEAKRRIEDARRRVESGVTSRDEVAQLERELAKMQARGDERRFMNEELNSQREQLERSRQLFEKGLVSRGQVAEVERLTRDLEQRGELEERRMKEMFDQLASRHNDERDRMAAQFAELEKTFKEQVRRSGFDEGQKRVFEDMKAQFEQLSKEYSRALSQREEGALAERLQRRETPREVAPEPSRPERNDRTEFVASRPIAAGDTLFVSIDGESQLPTSYRVDSSGSIRVPLLGAFKVLGQTPGQVREAIGKRLMDAKLGSPARVRVEIRRSSVR